jgi:hypothetical protein
VTIIAADGPEVGVLAIPVSNDCFNFPCLLYLNRRISLSVIDVCKANDERLSRCLNALYEGKGVFIIGGATRANENVFVPGQNWHPGDAKSAIIAGLEAPLKHVVEAFD